MADAQFEIRKDRREEYRWRLEAANHEIIADSGEGYTAKDSCKRAIETVRADIAKAKVVGLTRVQQTSRLHASSARKARRRSPRRSRFTLELDHVGQVVRTSRRAEDVVAVEAERP